MVKPIWIFAIDRNVQITVGHNNYGQYTMLLNFSLIFQIILDLGLQNFNNKEIAQSPTRMRHLFPNILAAKGVLALIYTSVVILFAFITGFRGYLLSLLAILCLVQILNSLLLYLRSNISAMHKFKLDSLLSVSDRLLMIMFCSILLFYKPVQAHFKIEWFIYAQILAYLITAGIALGLVIQFSKFDWSHYELNKTWAICKQSFPYALLIFLMSIYIRADVFLLGIILPNGNFHAGVYAAAYRLLDVANNITGVLFASMLLPIFGRMLVKQEKVNEVVRLSTNILLPVAITTALFTYFSGNQIMQLQLGSIATNYDGTVFSILMFAFPGYCIGYIYATLLTANGNVWLLIKISFIAVIINLLLNFILIPYYQAKGAAIACVITQLLLSLINILFAVKKTDLNPVLPLIIRYTVFSLAMFAECYFIYHYISGILLQFITVVSFCMITMSVIGFLPVKKLVTEFKKR